ncbi:MAG TPA: GAF domain-containing protein [Candidatus Obscuribacterales bacterium]
MAEIRLRSILRKELLPLAQRILQISHLPLAVYDVQGNVLAGEDGQVEADRYAIAVGEETLGWVQGGEEAAPLASLLSDLALRAVEKKTLANEVLDRYREINLLYNIAAKLTHCREVSTVATVALEEAQRLIYGTSAVLMLLNPETQVLDLQLMVGDPAVAEPKTALGEGIAGYVAKTGISEIVNDVVADVRYGEVVPGIRSLLCAPMKALDRVIGVISIHHSELFTYTAADLKLLTAIALQSAPAIENALFYQRQMEAARQREAKLQEQLQELRIEVDEAKRASQVAEITESDFFVRLRQKAKDLRQRR